MSATARWRWAGWERLRTVGIGNLALAVLLSAAGVWLVVSAGNNGSLLAMLLVQVSVWTLVIVRSAPLLASLVLAVTTLATQLVVGPLITCGVILPVLASMAFQLAARSVWPRVAVLTALGIAAGGAVELVFDPALSGDPAGALTVVLVLAGGFAIAGLVVRSRRQLLDTLQQRTDELARQRDRTAELAVQADRALVSENLELAIASRIEIIATAVEQGRRTLGTGAIEESRAALREIEQQGRETLAQMRTVVGSLHDAPTHPAPGLADLTSLLERAGSDARLHVSGPSRALGPHLELATYRIVEQLVTTLGERPQDRVEVVIRFGPDTLHVRVTGPRRSLTSEERRAQVAATTSAAQARAQVLGGRVAVVAAADRHEIDVRLPIPVPLPVPVAG